MTREPHMLNYATIYVNIKTRSPYGASMATRVKYLDGRVQVGWDRGGGAQRIRLPNRGVAEGDEVDQLHLSSLGRP